ncbi:MAG: DegT/DnrJ/EryC1/StrS family aminotransferase [Bacteroidetes bacterium]|nr:DegT/DnrJ/EryC1/StrS family aminotransferase [Bacteroidota bacterium]
MKVPYINLGLQHAPIKTEILKRIEKLLENGQFILGEEVRIFEKRFAELSQTKYALGVANGTDALFLSMLALGIGKGDEVITAPNSFLASASAIALIGATPVFADVRDDFNLDPAKVEKAITSKTKAIIAVHLTGRPAPIDELLQIAKKHNLHIIEDAAQAVSAEYKGKPVGGFGITGCFSLHPLKNLSAAGDGGVITTNDDKVYQYLVKARNHGLKSRDECELWSYNSRLDNLQAAILNVKLNVLDKWTERRREIASIYQQKFKGLDIVVPCDKSYEKAVYHTFIIQTSYRNELQKFLLENEIETKVHYPIPIYLQEAAKSLGYKKGDFPVTDHQVETILSLPVFAELTNEQVNYVCNKIIEFYTSKRSGTKTNLSAAGK